MGFGRKGLDDGAISSNSTSRGFGAQRAEPSADPYAAQREAFLASERARRREEGEDYGQTSYHSAPTRQHQPASRPTSYSPAKKKSLVQAYVLWWFGYALSAHRFYLRETRSAIIQSGGFIGGLLIAWIGSKASFSPLVYVGLASFLGALFWMVIDMFFIPGMCRRANAGLDAPHRIFE